MKLVNKKNNQSIVEFSEEKTVFHNKFLEQEMRTLGIPIPHGLRGVFQGKDFIYLGDADFQKAFREVYYLVSMNHDQFQWLE